MPSIKRKIARNTIANTTLKIATYAINFFLFPFIVFHVGTEGYGIYLLVGAFVGYFGLLDLGITSALEKYVAEHSAKGDNRTINEMINSSFVFYLGVGLIIFVLIIFIGTFYTDFFNIESSQVYMAKQIAYLTAIGALTSWPMRSFSSVLPGLQRYDISVGIQLLVTVVNALVTIFLLLAGYGILDLLFWGIVIGAFGQLATVIIVQRLLPYLDLKKDYMGISTLKKIFKFSSVVFVGQIVSLIVFGVDRIVIGAFVSVAAITYYAVARKIHDLTLTASNLPASALLPAATELDAKGEKDKLERLLIRGGKYKCALILSTATILIILSEPLIRFWMGEEFLEMVWPTQVFLSYWLLFAAWGVTGTVLLSLEKFKPILVLTVASGIGNVILSLLLVQWYGVLGVILGTVIPYFVLLIILIPYGLRLVGMEIKKYARDVWLRTYPIAGLTALGLIAIMWLYTPSSLIEVGLFGLAGLAIFGVVFYAFGLEKVERNDFKNYLFNSNR